MDAHQRIALTDWLRACLDAPDLTIEAVETLGGGSIQENWMLRCALRGDARRFVLRKDSPATIASSRPRAQEFAIMQAAFRAGVRVPEPVGFCTDPGVVGAPFAVMRLVDGVGLGPRIAKDLSLGGDRERLAEDLGRELAKIHAVLAGSRGAPDGDLAFLGTPDPRPALAQIRTLRGTLDAIRAPRPAIEWGLRWAERHAPDCPEPTLAHRDFRTGNYMVDAHGLTAILDWEFSGWGDPMEDIGWFCAECWRFGQTRLEAGGIAPRGAFYRSYERESGRRINAASVRFWEVMAHLRWAVIALEQGFRHISGIEPSLELALTGRIPPELERSVLRATAPDQWTA
ncbi:MAG: phosphotransferase family protein [Actinomycetospora chiangmaiensis]|nr:phosphotransferase family protein [Actinomycetospora chiangmaiensis]